MRRRQKYTTNLFLRLMTNHFIFSIELQVRYKEINGSQQLMRIHHLN